MLEDLERLKIDLKKGQAVFIETLCSGQRLQCEEFFKLFARIYVPLRGFYILTYSQLKLTHRYIGCVQVVCF